MPKDSETSYWLMKAEPNSRIVKGKDVKFSIDDLAEMKISPWDGVRNYEARNILRDKMKIGDEVLFYHSNCKEPGIVGLARIVKEGYPDFTAFDPKHPYFDPKSNPEAPRWFMVDVEFVSKFPKAVSLKKLQSLKNESVLVGLPLLNRGRLSVQPVSQEAFYYISKLAHDE